MSSEYIKKIKTYSGEKQIDYNALANLPTIPQGTKDLFNDAGFLDSIPLPTEVTLGGIKARQRGLDETAEVKLGLDGKLYVNNLSKELETQKNRIDSIVALDAELQDIRIGGNGIAYSSAGEAVREQTKNIPDKAIITGNYIRFYKTSVDSDVFLFEIDIATLVENGLNLEDLELSTEQTANCLILNMDDGKIKKSVELPVVTDSELSLTSTNPVQNRVITEQLNYVKKEKADQKELKNYVKTINGVSPDENGNVVVTVSGGSADVCPYEKVNSIEEMTDTSKQYLMNGYVYSYKVTSGVEVPNFTNQIPIATDADGNVYNGCGYKDETRFNSSNAEVSATGRFVTGFIPVTNGDVIRFGDMKWDTDNDASHHNIIFYNDKNGSPVTKLSASNSGQTSNMTKDSDGCVTQFTAPSGYTYSFMRVSSSYGESGSGSGAIITKNEEIAYRVTDGTSEWVKGEKWTTSGGSTNSGSTSGGTVTEEVAIPEYWKSHLDTKITTIKELQDVVGDDLVSFPFFTDLHCNANPSYNLGRNIGLLSNEVMNRCDIPFAVCGGDTNSNGNVTSKDAVESCIENAMDIFAPIKDRLLLARGNHDITYGGSSSTNNAYQWQYSPSELYNKLFRWQATDFRRVFDAESDGTYFYVDDKARKTRFIVLDSQWVEWQGRKDDGSVNYNGHHNSGYGQRQLEWLANKALQFDEDGWICIIVTHVPPTSVTYNGSTRNYLNETRDGVIFKEIVNAFCNKTSYTGTYTGTAEWQNVDISVDFTPRKGNVACILSGHCHVDRIIEDELPCPIITFTCASNIPRTGEETETRTFGTTNETAFDIVSIDRANNKIYMTRVGIGSDRECSYRAEVSPYTLVPKTTITVEDWEAYEGEYMQESTFMFEQGKSYKVMWDGVEYIVEYIDMSDGETIGGIIGNGAGLELEDNGLPFIIATVEEDGVKMLMVIDWLAVSGQIDEYTTRTFSVVEIVEEDLPIYSGASTATDVTYDNSTSGLEAEDVQGAVDELVEKGEFVIRVTEDDNGKLVADKTFDEIVEAYTNNKRCVVIYSHIVYVFRLAGNEMRWFEFDYVFLNGTDRLNVRTIHISGANISLNEFSYEVSEDIDNELNEDSYNAVSNASVAKQFKTVSNKINFLEETEKTFKDMLETSGTETLTWDGNTDGKPSLLGITYKVADYAPTMEELSNGYIVTVTDNSVNTAVEMTSDLIVQNEDTFGLIFACATEEYAYPYFIIVPTDNFEISDDISGDTVTFEKGIYFLHMGEQTYISSLKINGYVFGNGYKIKGDCVNISESLKADIVQEVLSVLNGSSVIGVVDGNNVITITSDLPSGNYILKYENADGTYTEIGTITVDGGGNEPTVVNLANPSDANWKTNYRINSSGTEVQITDAGSQTCIMTNIFDVTGMTTLHVKGLNIKDNLTNGKNYGRIYFYDANDDYTAYCQPSTETFVTVADYDGDVLLIDVAAAIADSGYTVIKKFRLGGFLTGTAEDVIIQADAQIV